MLKAEYDRQCKIKTLQMMETIKQARPDDFHSVKRLEFWLWLFDDENPTPSLISYLQSIGFRRAEKRQAYAHSCGRRSRRGRRHPRDKYRVNEIG